MTRRRLPHAPVWLLVPLALISACASLPPPEQPVKIYNLRQGLARLEPNLEWTIYAEGDNFPHRVNGTCIVAGSPTPCMQFGVAFEFSAQAETTVLTCRASFSRPTDVVTPKEVLATKTNTQASTAELRGRSGKVFWQGYNVADGTAGPNTTSVTCEHEGKEVLRYAFTITEQPEPAR